MPDSQRLQFINSFIDYLKHLTTLSTASIVLMATFWEKLSAKPILKSAVAVAICGFMISVLGSVMTHTIFVIYEIPGRTVNDLAAFIGGLGLLFTWLGFLIGISSLAAFAIKNILRKRDD